MTRNLKALTLAVFAIWCIGAVGALPASAVSQHVITCSAAESCSTTGTGTTTFGTKGSSLSVACSSEQYAATAKSGVTEVTVTPTYSGCTALGGKATIATAGCNYILHGKTTSHLRTDDVSTETDASVDVECAAGKSIVITSEVLPFKEIDCTIVISAQTGRHGVTFLNEGVGATRDLKVTITVDGIHYTTSGLICPMAGLPSSGEDGFLTGTVTVKGYVDGSKHGAAEHVGLLIEEI